MFGEGLGTLVEGLGLDEGLEPLEEGLETLEEGLDARAGVWTPQRRVEAAGRLLNLAGTGSGRSRV